MAPTHDRIEEQNPAAAESLRRIWLSSHRPADVDGIRRGLAENLKFRLGIRPDTASLRDVYLSLAYTVRDLVIERLHAADRAYDREGKKSLCYLSMEFLIGRLLVTNILNLGLVNVVEEALVPLDISLSSLVDLEPEAGLGNGGLGRLAACFLDSLATQGYPATGYGICYEHGMFRQEITDGRQVEQLDSWLRFTCPWLIKRSDHSVRVDFYGTVVDGFDAAGAFRPTWVDTKPVMGVPHDIPIVGYGGQFVNTLRLWSATATAELDLDLFNQGDYIGAAREKTSSEAISKILYPNDNLERGRELRLMQEYFFVACSVADVMRRFFLRSHDLRELPDRFAIQLNDTHPALAIVELLRILIDTHRLDWSVAWDLVVRSTGYTNHTLLPEALEKWPASLLQKVLPRHLMLIREIDRRLRDAAVLRWPAEPARIAQLAILDAGTSEQVRMAHLAVVGSHATNGVSALHSELLQTHLFEGFHELWPERFSNKTNGVTQRLWLLKANPRLAGLLTRTVGPDWVIDLSRLDALRDAAQDRAFTSDLRAIKLANKIETAAFIHRMTGIEVRPGMLFDVQVKRLHEYKRQLMNALGTLVRYRRLKAGRGAGQVPRAVIFAGKAAPGYFMAKLILRFICRVADLVNKDEAVRGRLAVGFLPNYGVSMAEQLIPAADLSEQISTAGCEASGTGNMKFAMNGALTLGTLDGANIEMRDAIGHDAFFNFGLTASEIAARRAGYDPRAVLADHGEIADVVDLLADGALSPEEPELFRSLHHALIGGGDRFFVLADLPAWLEAQDRVDALYSKPAEWDQWVVKNIAGTGQFSSDRTIRQYATEIWGLTPVF